MKCIIYDIQPEVEYIFQGAILERARKINYLLEDGGKETYSFALWSPNLVLNRLCIGHLFTRLATRSSLYGNKKWPINIYIYMLFTGWEVRMVKNCDLGLENTARGRGQHFEDRGQSFSPYEPTLSR